VAEAQKQKTDSADAQANTADTDRQMKEHANMCRLMYPLALLAVQETMGSDLKFAPRLITIDRFRSKRLNSIGGMHFVSNVIITLGDLEDGPMPSYYHLANKLTHEITHAWLKYSKYELPTAVVEGVCELSAVIATRKMFSRGRRITINEAIADLIFYSGINGGLAAEYIKASCQAKREEMAQHVTKYVIPAYAIVDEMVKWRDLQPEKNNASPTEFIKHLMDNWKNMDGLSKLRDRNSPAWVSRNIKALNERMSGHFSSLQNKIPSPIESTLPGYFTMLLRGKLNSGPDLIVEQKWQVLLREEEEKKELAEQETAKLRFHLLRLKLVRPILSVGIAYGIGYAVRDVWQSHASLTDSAQALGVAAISVGIGIYLMRRLSKLKKSLSGLAESFEEVASILKNAPKDGQNSP
jgi:hypothetical protein